MKAMAGKGARFLALVALVATASGCGLPRPGPTKNEIFAGSVQRQGDAFVIAVNDRVTRATAVIPALGFGSSFEGAGRLGSDQINPGDILGITIYENVEDGLLASAGQKVSLIDEVQVDGEGFIFVPYAGRLMAAGNSPEALRALITEKLDVQTPDPQVIVRRLAGDGSTVSVMGGVGGQGVYPIERPTRTLTAMLARAGGVIIPPETAVITVTRGDRQGRIWFQDLYQRPSSDIALRNGDRVLVQEDTRAFTVLGATGAQNRVPFETQVLSAIEALAIVGGLNTNFADPTGVFVFRTEPAEIANAVLGRDDLVGDQRFVYVLDLTEPVGMFLARDFVIRDQDLVYVTEAPYVAWQKTLTALTGVTGAAASIRSAAEGGSS